MPKRRHELDDALEGYPLSLVTTEGVDGVPDCEQWTRSSPGQPEIHRQPNCGFVARQGVRKVAWKRRFLTLIRVGPDFEIVPKGRLSDLSPNSPSKTLNLTTNGEDEDASYEGASVELAHVLRSSSPESAFPLFQGVIVIR